MYHKIKRFTALLVCLTLLFSVVPAGTYADVMSSAWMNPTRGIELEKAETYHSKDASSVTLYKGEEYSYPIGIPFKSVDSTKNTNRTVADAEIKDEDGTIFISAISEGFTTYVYELLTGYDANGNKQLHHGSVVIRVIDPTLTIEGPVTAVEGEIVQLTATGNCKSSDSNAIIWESLDSNIATVDESGKVTCKAAGSVQITAKKSITMNGATSDLTDNITIQVKNILEKLTLKLSQDSPDELCQIDMAAGDKADIAISYTPANYEVATENITVRSTNPDVVTVTCEDSKKLSLEAVGKGSATVIVSCAGQRALLQVYVGQNSMRVEPKKLEIVQGSTYTIVTKIEPVSSGNGVKVKVVDGAVAKAKWVGEGKNICTVTGLSEGDTEIVFSLPGTTDQTVQVKVVADEQATKQTYTVTFVDYNGTVLLTKQVNAGQSIPIPPVPNREGYQFDGFRSSETSDNQKYTDTVTVNGNMVLEAQYVPIVYTVTFDDTEFSTAHSITPPEAQTVQHGELLQQPTYQSAEIVVNATEAEGEKRYYRFDGWKVKGTVEKWNFQTPVTSDLVLEPDWQMTYVQIILRTFKGNYGDPISVPKGKKNVVINNIPKFTWGDPHHTYTYTNNNGVGKDVFFCFWQHGDKQIKEDSYTITEAVMRDEIITAVYEPGAFGDNRVNSTYYHSTNVYVPVEYVVQSTGVEIHDEVVLTDVYPYYRQATLPEYGLDYKTSIEAGQVDDLTKTHDYKRQISSNEDEKEFDVNEFTFNYENTAKYGTVDLSYRVGQEFTDPDTGKGYRIVGIDQSTVKTVWMCDMLGHVFNGYCVGGTWNALGQATFFLEEITEETSKIKISYYMLPVGWKQGDSLNGAVLKMEEVDELTIDQVLTYKDYVDHFGGVYPNVDYKWVDDSNGSIEGSYTAENEEYELKLYYASFVDNTAITITSKDGTWQYDGGEHTQPVYTVFYGDQKIQPDAGTTNVFTLPTGDKLTVTDPGSVQNVNDSGENNNTFTYTIDNSQKYTNVSTTYGKLTITPKSVTVTLTGNTETKTYDGTPKTVNSYTVKTNDPNYTETDFTYTGTAVATGTNVGEYPMELDDEKLENQNPNYDVTFVTIPGKLKIEPVQLKITSVDGTWPYDGEEHTKPEYTVTYGGVAVDPDENNPGVFTLPTGDTLTVMPTKDAHVTNVSEGKVKNSFTYELENEGNYAEVTTEFGDLSITPKPVTIKVSDSEKIIDEQDPVFENATLKGELTETDNKNLTDIDLSVSRTDSGNEEIGTHGDVLTISKSKQNLEDEYPNYDFTIENGDFTIKGKEITITSLDGTWPYDGKEHTHPVYTVTYGNETIAPDKGTTNVFTLPTGDKLTVTPTGDACVTNVSDSKEGNNTFTYVLENEGNYADVTTEFGDLSITPKPVTITVPGAQKDYGTEDPEEFSKGKLPDDLTETDKKNLTDIDLSVIRTDSGNEDIGTHGDVLTTNKSEQNLEDEYPNYDFTIENGDFTIKGKEITITSLDGTWPYDGKEHTHPVYTVTYGNETIAPDKGTTNVFTLPTGDTLTVTPSAEGVTNVSDSGTDNNTFTYELENAENYADITMNIGDLSITPKPVTVTLTGNTKTETYDGTPKTVNGYTVEISEPDYTEADFTYTGTSVATGTNVGEYPMELDEDKLINKNPNYDVTFETVPGELTIIAVDLVVTKTSDKTNKKVAQGEKITYTITVENKSSMMLTNVKVDDEKTGLHEVIPLMLPGAKNEFTTTWTVTEQDVLAGKILNSVTAKADPITNPQDPDHPFVPQGEADVTDTPVDVAVELVVVKTSDKEGRRVAEGETITYTIIVKNKGNVTLHQVKVDDEKTGLHTVVASLAPGAMKEFTTTWIVTEADVNAGKILNSVTAKANPVKDPKNPKVPIVPQDTDTVEDKAARTPHRVTVNYYLDSIGGETVAPQVVQVHYAGDDFSIESPVIPGYTASIEVVEGTMGSGDVVYNVIYTPTVYQLTIKYVDADGNPVQPPYQDGLKAGESYSSNSPSVDGMICTRPVVDGIMPDYDLEIVVIYLDAEQYVVVDEPAAPKGIGTVTLNAGDCFE